MNYLLGTLLILFTIGALAFLWNTLKTALTAAKHHEGLIWSGFAIGLALLILMHLGFWTSFSRQSETSDRLDSVGLQVKDLRANQTTLNPLVTNVAALLNLGSRVELADAKADKAMAQVSEFSDAHIVAMNKLSTNINSRIDERLMALRIALQKERLIAPVTSPFNDGNVIIAPQPPQEAPQPAPRAAIAPPTVSQPTQPPMAIGVTVPPGYSIQRDNSSELAKVEKRLADLEKARENARQAQKTKTAQKAVAAAADKGGQAEQVALLAMKQVTELNVRQGKMDDKLADMSKAIDKVLAFMISTNVSLPAMLDTNTPAAAVPQAIAPVAAAAAQPAASAQPAPAPSVVAPTNSLVSFTVTNVYTVGRSVFQMQRLPWQKGGLVVYEVVGKVNPGDNLVVARNMVEATIARFHKDNGVWFAGKDPSNAEVSNKFVFEFGEALKAVRKGNPGWEHLKIEPSFRTSSNNGAANTNAVTTNTRQANASLPP